MNDTSFEITAALERLYPVTAEPDWASVIASVPRRSPQRVVLAIALVTAFVGAIALTTPLGAALARGLDDFSAWINGEPGKPAPSADQRRFDQANARSWVGFPKGTRLRELLTTESVGKTVTLYGFRSGDTFCVKLKISGATGTAHCAPIADLRRTDSPVRVLVADQPIGKGSKTAWYGIDRVHSAHLQITAGIAADSVSKVLLRDDQGRHTVPVQSNAFVYIAKDPEVGQRVSQISAVTPQGSVAVPFAPRPFGIGSGSSSLPSAPTVAVTAPLKTGRIAWIDQHEKHGAPLSSLPARLRHGLLGFRGSGARSRVIFGRVLTPDRSRPTRVVVTLNAHRHGGPAAGICVYGMNVGGGVGGCAPYPDTFTRSPFDFSTTGGGSATFVEVSGVAADGVARLSALLANRQSLPVPLTDNAFLGDIPTARLPARLVAFDNKGRVVGASDPIGGFSMPGPRQLSGKAKQLLAVKGPRGSHAELLVGRASGGGECAYFKTYISRREAGTSISCRSAAWQGFPVQLSVATNFILGRVRPDIVKVRVDYEGGNSSTLAPTRSYVLASIPAAHLAAGARPIRFSGINSAGQVVAGQEFPKPPPVSVSP
jgi:hypothetical protein